MKYLQFFVSLFGALAFATGSFAQQASPAQVEQFLDILADNGCLMSEEVAEKIFPSLGLGQDLSRQIVGQLIENGTVAFIGSSLTIVDGSCVADPAEPVNQQQFLDIMALNGCRISETDAKIIFPENGMDFDIAAEMAERLFDLGLATLSESDNTITIASDLCVSTAESDMADPQAIIEILELPEIEAFGLLIEIAVENDCRINGDDAVSLFEASGLNGEQGMVLSMRLVGQGLAEQVDNDIFYLPGQPCVVGASDQSERSNEEIFIAILLDNSCTISELDARLIFPSNGLPMEDVYNVADAFVNAGDAFYSEDDRLLTLTLPECAVAEPVEIVVPAEQPDEVVTPIEQSDEMADDIEQQFLMVLASNNCEISQSNAREVFASASIDFNTAMGIAAQMMGDGRASSPDGGQTLQIAAPLCVVAAAGAMEPRDIFIDLLRSNNCTLTAADFGMLLPVDGLDQNTAFGLIADLEADGVITLPPTRDVVTLTAENCR